jgi:hypothetical protein
MNWKEFWNNQARVNDPKAQVGRLVSGSLHQDDLMDKISDKIAHQIQLNSNVAISHVIPEYALPLTKEILEEARGKTQEKVKTILLDWKGCGKSEQRKELIAIMTYMVLNNCIINSCEKMTLQ